MRYAVLTKTGGGDKIHVEKTRGDKYEKEDLSSSFVNGTCGGVPDRVR
jgi:hypothetical protein